MKRSRSHDIEEREQEAKRHRCSIDQLTMATRGLMKIQPTELFREHTIQTEKLFRDALADHNYRLFGHRAHEQGRSSSSAEIGDVDRDGGSSRATAMADPVDARGNTRVDVAKINELRCHGVKVVPSAAESALRWYAATPNNVSNRDPYWATMTQRCALSHVSSRHSCRGWMNRDDRATPV